MDPSRWLGMPSPPANKRHRNRPTSLSSTSTSLPSTHIAVLTSLGVLGVHIHPVGATPAPPPSPIATPGPSAAAVPAHRPDLPFLYPFLGDSDIDSNVPSQDSIASGRNPRRRTQKRSIPGRPSATEAALPAITGQVARSALPPYPTTLYPILDAAGGGASSWQAFERASLPDQYVQGSDGLWRKTEALASQTACVMPSAAQDVSTSATAGPSSSGSIDSNTSSSPEEFDMSTIPEGWRVEQVLSSSSLIAIIVLSVAVAAAIIILMACCIAWRRSRRRQRDVERRIRRKAIDAPSDENLTVILASTQKKWVKASLRWKENIRYAARRRRSARPPATSRDGGSDDDNLTCSRRSHSPRHDHMRRPYSPSSSSISSSSAFSSPLSSRPPPSPPPSVHGQSSSSSYPTSLRPPSPSASLASRSSLASSPQHTQPRPPSPFLSPPPLSPSPPPAQQHPPAYFARGHAHAPPDDAAPLYDRAGPSKLPGAISGRHMDMDDEDAPYGGHIATDDKTVLAARAALASAPSLRLSSHRRRQHSDDEDVSGGYDDDLHRRGHRPLSVVDGTPTAPELDDPCTDVPAPSSPPPPLHPATDAYTHSAGAPDALILPPPPMPLCSELGAHSPEKLRQEYAYAVSSAAMPLAMPVPSAPPPASPLFLSPSAPPPLSPSTPLSTGGIPVSAVPLAPPLHDGWDDDGDPDAWTTDEDDVCRPRLRVLVQR